MSGWRKNQVGELKVREHCNMLLEAMVGKDLAPQWWDSPNRAFDGRKPRDTELSLVHSYLLNNAFGGEYL